MEYETFLTVSVSVLILRNAGGGGQEETKAFHGVLMS